MSDLERDAPGATRERIKRHEAKTRSLGTDLHAAASS